MTSVELVSGFLLFVFEEVSFSLGAGRGITIGTLRSLKLVTIGKRLPTSLSRPIRYILNVV